MRKWLIFLLVLTTPIVNASSIGNSNGGRTPTTQDLSKVNFSGTSIGGSTTNTKNPLDVIEGNYQPPANSGGEKVISGNIGNSLVHERGYECTIEYLPERKGINVLNADNVKDAVTQSPEVWNNDWKIFDHVGYKDSAFSGERHVVKRNEGVQFFGYQIPGYKNWMMRDFGNSYPKKLSSMQFPIRADWHTVEGSGVIFNANLQGDSFSAYAVVSTMDSVEVRKYSPTSAQALLNGVGNFELLYNEPRECPTQRIVVEWDKNKAVIYDGAKKLLEIENMTYFGDYAGPFVSYRDHNCTSLSSTLFTEFLVDGINYLNYKKN